MVQIGGQPWFVAADVCRALSVYLRDAYTVNTSAALSKLAHDEKCNVAYAEAKRIGLQGIASRAYGIATVTESGLYKLIMRSDKPEARKFQDWVTREVLPAIRKDGAYIMGEEKVRTGEMDEDEFILKAVSAIAPIVENKLGRTVTNSRAVAEFFGKRHDNVLRDVDTLLAHASVLRDGFFTEATSPHPTVRGRMVRHFDMTKDGFTLLAMGFTGSKALAFKLAYIARFNEMQEELRKSHRTAYLGQVECRVS